MASEATKIPFIVNAHLGLGYCRLKILNLKLI